MNPDIRQTLREEWTSAAPYWKKWDRHLATQSQAATDLVVKGAQLAPGLRVLDLASGTGQPALTIAKAVGPTGHVTASDLTSEMLDALKENAHGITNLDAKVADAEHLPFSNAEFDRVTCRFGIMFLPDIQTALKEIRRVLKPAGRFSFLVWGPLEENPIFSSTILPFMKHVNVPPPPPDAPTIFRFADPAKLKTTLDAAGFHDVAVTKQKISWPWPGAPEEAWEAVRELAAPFKKVIAAVPPDKLPGVMHDVMNNLKRLYDGKQVNFTASVILATGSA
jgi:ubiquinone/menaquinone biosynthesis C-methylase UbiE